VTSARLILLWLRDVLVFSSEILCRVAPLMPTAVYKRVMATESHPNLHVEYREQALSCLLLSLVLFNLLSHLQWKPSKPWPRPLQEMRHMKTSMALLEREIEVACFASQLCCITSRIRAEKNTKNGRNSSYEFTPSLSLSRK
jgi:hypothetical protein